MDSDRLRRISALVGLQALLAAIFALHLFVLYPQGHVAVLYTLPVLLAAWLFRPAVAFSFAASALALHGVESWMEATSILVWAAEAAAIGLIAALGIWATEQWRAQARLAEENAALAEEQRREAERMRTLAAEQGKLSRQLMESRRQREQFLGVVTHEIAGVLTVLSGHAQLLSRLESKPSNGFERSASAILVQSRRLTGLVNDLRDVSRIEEGRFQIRLGRCDLVAVARSVIEEQQPMAPHHRLLLENEVETLPGEWDGERLIQVLSNLVRNAVSYSPEGGEVRVTVLPVDGRALVSVGDQGVGIAAEDIQHLFKPYSRLERTSGVKGTGLGLYLSRAIVEAHGGSLEVKSELGKGTTFTVVLPLERETDSVPEPLSAQPAPSARREQEVASRRLA